ncbi:MAG: hypothetical protein ABSG41_27530 [Bryobacteraceae bacterium]|jgi:hypothetical protein
MTAKASRQLSATAYHEAGHAVAAWRLGLKFRHVTIKPDSAGNSLGHLWDAARPKWFRPDMDSSDRARLRAQRHIVVSLSGQVAEWKFLGREPRYGMWSDNNQAADMALRLCGSEETTNAFLHYCFCWARDLVAVRWKEVEAVAKALLKTETLSFDDVIETITPGATALRASLEAATDKKPSLHSRGQGIIPEHLRPGYSKLMAARYDGLDTEGWKALMKDTLHLPLSMLPAVKRAVKLGVWRHAKDPVKCVTETAERDTARTGSSGKPAVPKGE